LIIRAVVSQEGLALRLDPDFKIISVAYPYVAKRLLAGDTSEMREKLLDVIFDESGRLRLERLESLLEVVGQGAPSPGVELLPVAGAGLRLLFSRDGADLRKRLLLTLIRDDRLHTDDVRALGRFDRQNVWAWPYRGRLFAAAQSPRCSLMNPLRSMSRFENCFNA